MFRIYSNPMKWTDEHDIPLVREILTEEPYTHRPKVKNVVLFGQ